MTKKIVITSGKGGVGKTTSSASIAFGLAEAGKKVCVIDFDIGLRNLDLILGVERRVVYNFINVIEGTATISQALIRHKDSNNLYILAASQTQDKDALTKEGVQDVIKQLEDLDFDYIICDSPAGIEQGAMMSLYFADEAVVVTNPEISSVRDSDRILGMLDSKSQRAEEGMEPVKQHLLITRYDPARVEAGEMLSIEDVQDILGEDLNLLAVTPESRAVIDASNNGKAVITYEDQAIGKAYKDAVSRLLGNHVELEIYVDKPKGFLSKLFGGGN